MMHPLDKWSPLYVDGDWSLETSMWFNFNHSIIITCNCESQPTQTWAAYRHFNLPCSVCREFIPDHIQAMWVLLTGDMAP